MNSNINGYCIYGIIAAHFRGVRYKFESRNKPAILTTHIFVLVELYGDPMEGVYTMDIVSVPRLNVIQF
jgi:hypothetical protein